MQNVRLYTGLASLLITCAGCSGLKLPLFDSPNTAAQAVPNGTTGAIFDPRRANQVVVPALPATVATNAPVVSVSTPLPSYAVNTRVETTYPAANRVANQRRDTTSYTAPQSKTYISPAMRSAMPSYAQANNSLGRTGLRYETPSFEVEKQINAARLTLDTKISDTGTKNALFNSMSSEAGLAIAQEAARVNAQLRNEVAPTILPGLKSAVQSVPEIQRPIQSARTFSLLTSDNSVRAALNRWVRSEGYQDLVWDLREDVPIERNATFDDALLGAIESVMVAMRASSTPTRACFYSNKVVRIIPSTRFCSEPGQ